MKIKKIAIGNKNEAFIETRINDGVNIIYSNDNNKGKTILIQGLMYALGNEPVFPKGFNPNNYYFYVEIEIKNKLIEFLRHKDTFLVILDENLYEFSSLIDLKYFVNSNIQPIPKIIKDGNIKLVDFVLLFELFFIGQDKRNTSNIINIGYYNKKDFENLLASINGNLISDITEEQKNVKEKIKEIKSRIATTKKLLKLTKENSTLATWINKYDDEISVSDLKNNIKSLNEDISQNKRRRKREIDRKERLENLITELNSLNREIKEGKVYCKDCGSDKIIYSNSDFVFDVTNATVRNKIIQSINEQIKIKEELINEYTNSINKSQESLKNIMIDIPEDFKTILLFKDEILSEQEYDNQLSDLNKELVKLQQNMNVDEEQNKIAKKGLKQLKDAIIEKMNYYYKLVDTQGQLVFDDLFTVKNTTYSGSDEQEYYFCRTLAISDCTKHNYPIIMDFFRGGEISSNREHLMIDCYKKLNKQVIVTATLKDEEYLSFKYSNSKDITTIDYSEHTTNKILSANYNELFKSIVEKFNIIVE